MVPTGVSKVPMGAYWGLRVPNGVSGYLLVSEGAYECRLESEGACWCLWVAAGDCGRLLVSEGAYWCLRMRTGV